MKRQSLRAAMRCETATNKRCRCRCGGLLHGAKRAGAVGQKYFENLPADDPHHVADEAEIKKARKLARADKVRAEAVKRGQERLFEEA